MAENINYQEFKIAREIEPLFMMSIKGLGKKLLENKINSKWKVLVVDNCIIGDFLATLPALRFFIKKYKINVDIVVSGTVKTLAERIKGVENVFISKSSYRREVENNKKYKKIRKIYDLIIVLRISPDSYNLIKKVKYSYLFNSNRVYFRYIWHMIKNTLLRKKVKQSREAIFEIFREKIPKKIKFDDIFIFKKEDYNKIKKIPEMKGNYKKIIIHTGSGWKAKLWNDDKWAELINEVNMLGKFRFIFVGGTNEEEKSFDYIKKKLDFKVYSLIGKVDLKELFLIMKKSDYFIGIDSGPRNMAHFANLRSITLLGPGIRNFGLLDKRDIIIDKFNPLSSSLFHLSKRGGMEKINVGMVIKEFKKLRVGNNP